MQNSITSLIFNKHVSSSHTNMIIKTQSIGNTLAKHKIRNTNTSTRCKMQNSITSLICNKHVSSSHTNMIIIKTQLIAGLALHQSSINWQRLLNPQNTKHKNTFGNKVQNSMTPLICNKHLDTKSPKLNQLATHS